MLEKKNIRSYFVYSEEKERTSRKREEMENFEEKALFNLALERYIFDLAKMLGWKSFLSRENRISPEVEKWATKKEYMVPFLLAH